MRTKAFLYSTFSTVIMQTVQIVALFIIPKTIIVFYGSEVNGVVSSITQFLNYFMVVEAGLSGAAIFALYEPLANKEKEKINIILSAAKNYYYKSGFAYLLLLLVFAFLYSNLISVSSINKFELVILIFGLGFAGLTNFFSLAKYRVLLTSDQKTYIISTATTASVILFTLIIVVGAKNISSVAALYMIASVSFLLRTFILKAYVKSNYKGIVYNIKGTTSVLGKRWDVLYLQLLGAVHSGSPMILATLIVSMKDVSVFSVYNLIVMGVITIASVFNSGLGSSFGDVIVKREWEVLRKAYDEFEAMYFSILSIVFSCVFILLIPFIRLYIGVVSDAEYIKPLVGFLATLNGFLFCLKSPHGMLVISAGLFRETRWQTLIQGSLVVIVGLICGVVWKIEGILFGMIVSNVYRLIDLNIFISKYFPVIKRKKTIARSIKSFIIVILFSLIARIFQIDYLSLWGWMGYGLLITLIVLLYELLYYISFDRVVLVALINRGRYIMGQQI